MPIFRFRSWCIASWNQLMYFNIKFLACPEWTSLTWNYEKYHSSLQAKWLSQIKRNIRKLLSFVCLLCPIKVKRLWPIKVDICKQNSLCTVTLHEWFGISKELVHATNKENINDQHYWNSVRGALGDRWIPLTKEVCNAESVPKLWSHRVKGVSTNQWVSARKTQLHC